MDGSGSPWFKGDLEIKNNTLKIIRADIRNSIEAVKIVDAN